MSRTLAPTDPRARVVTAPAGSGKTTLLLHHYLRHLQTTSIERIVAITFTRKAAGELLERLARILRGVLDPASAGSEWKSLRAQYKDVLPDAARAHAALAALDAAPVATVDAFALAMVQEFLLEAHFEFGRDKVHVDGPVTSGADTSPFYEAAARTALEAMSPAARRVIEELGFADAIADVALLARQESLSSPSVASLLDALGKVLAPHVRKQGERLLELPAKLREQALLAVQAWLRTPKGRPPAAMLLWITCVSGPEGDALRGHADAVLEGLGLRLRWRDLDDTRFTFRLADWHDDGAIERADEVRADLIALSREAREGALRALAAEGTLGYEELLLVATRLCLSPPAALRERYDVLLVDELQDTNPAQLEFYRAFAQLRTGKQGIATFFVGDARQSIYRFRHADPHGWAVLVDEARARGELASLDVNYRSSRQLVEVQKALFAALTADGELGVDTLERLEAAPDAPAGVLGGAHSTPVMVVDEATETNIDPYALAAFAERLEERWAGHPHETAAVLVRSWAQASWAVLALRQHAIAAQLTGDRALLMSQVAVDLRVLLGALIDLHDEIAMAAMLKHPAVGLSDRGLLLLRTSGSFARLFAGAPDLSMLPENERAALEHALPHLCEARRRLGREPTADVVERLAAALGWRALIAAGPEGEHGVGLAELDLLLDLLRQAEVDVVDPQAARDVLDADRPGELPLVRLHGADRVVTVTTVFGAKGLEFDHVLLLQNHAPGHEGLQAGRAVVLGRPAGVPLVGLALDPLGALGRSRDPIAVLAAAAGAVEGREEGFRLFYVGFTRAARSVTLGLRKPRKSQLQAALRAAFHKASEEEAIGRAIRIVGIAELAPRSPKRPVRRRTGLVHEAETQWAPQVGRVQARPSAASDFVEASALAEELARGDVVVGATAPSLPVISGLEGITEVTWGQVVHGWLERWQFSGTPSAQAARDYLGDCWSLPDPQLAAWLVALGTNLVEGLPGFRDLVTSAERLHFELPIVGVDADVLWTGRTDLILELPGRKVAVIDFKAGHQYARPGNIPHAAEYAAQLEAYRRAFEGAGRQVVELGLVYVRGASWVRWCPPRRAVNSSEVS